MNILIADDDEGDRKQVKRALKQAGLPFECTEAQSIDEALMACASEEFDCAIVDYRMPGRDGLEGIAALSERQPFMSIIMSTGEGDETVATEAMNVVPRTIFEKSTSIRIQFGVASRTQSKNLPCAGDWRSSG